MAKDYFGMSRTRVYRCYKSMLYRCYYPSCNDYKHYGARGICVCNEWRDDTWGFIKFYAWALNNGYSDNLTLDRIDVNGNYCPENCRWVTWKEQQNNKRVNVVIYYKGMYKTLMEWSEYLNIPYYVLGNRYERGVSVDKLLDKNILDPQKHIEYKGEIHSISEWAKIYGFAYGKMRSRLKRYGYNMYNLVNHFEDMKRNTEVTN